MSRVLEPFEAKVENVGPDPWFCNRERHAQLPEIVPRAGACVSTFIYSRGALLGKWSQLTNCVLGSGTEE